MDTPAPQLECNVIMKGGITSGVVYPRALTEFAKTYRFRSLGGASAGAIGAAFGAAAEHGRATGSFDRLGAIPQALGEGRLAALFQPQPATRPMLGVLLTATGHDAPGPGKKGLARLAAVAGALLRGYPVAAILGALPGLAGLLWATRVPLPGAVGFALASLVVLAVGLVIALALAVWRTLTRDVPANQFGICTGLGTGQGPGFTDWLSTQIDDLAGRPPGQGPLLYGHLWTGSNAPAPVAVADRRLDLRMVTTCLSQSRPYEMPWEGRLFFYEPAVWARLFPADVMQALLQAPGARAPEAADQPAWDWEDAAAASHPRGLRRLPDPQYLPVIVSVRMSLSFPLLISAVPLWIIDRRSAETREAVAAFRAGHAGASPAFTEVWFTDGGFCSNFPVHLFDEALPTRPTFAINLGSFLAGREPSADQRRNIEFATDNAPLLPSHRSVPTSGAGALTGFFGAALATSREWADASQLTSPGMRDRVVRVLQSSSEGGLNLFMDTATIEALADRGRVAAASLVDMFTRPHYRQDRFTGWDNHRWVRYRALLAALPAWYSSFAQGHAELAGLDPADPPSYPLTVGARTLAGELDALTLAAAAKTADPGRQREVASLQERPNPRTVIRRVPLM